MNLLSVVFNKYLNIYIRTDHSKQKMKSFIIEPTNAMFIQEKIDTRPFNDKFHGETFATPETEVVSSLPSKHKMAPKTFGF